MPLTLTLLGSLFWMLLAWGAITSMGSAQDHPHRERENSPIIDPPNASMPCEGVGALLVPRFYFRIDSDMGACDLGLSVMTLDCQGQLHLLSGAAAPAPRLPTASYDDSYRLEACRYPLTHFTYRLTPCHVRRTQEF